MIKKSYYFLPYGESQLCELLSNMLENNEYFIPDSLKNAKLNDPQKQKALRSILHKVCLVTRKQNPGT